MTINKITFEMNSVDMHFISAELIRDNKTRKVMMPWNNLYTPTTLEVSAQETHWQKGLNLYGTSIYAHVPEIKRYIKIED